MKRPATKIVAASVVIGAAMIGVTSARLATREMPCGDGFVRSGFRCCARSGPVVDGQCPAGPMGASERCPSPLVPTDRGCDAPLVSVVDVPATSVLIGPSDWEAEGRVVPRTVKAGPLRLDRFEVTVGRAFCPTCPLPRPDSYERNDPGRAASHVSLDEARAYCHAKGGRLPTEDEWIVAAAGDKPRRYPWGDTGAVCRRGAWGLTNGPCASGAVGPDTVGTHPDGATPSGIHDLAGNVAEWVEPNSPALPHGGSQAEQAAKNACGGSCAVARGGAFDTALATDLRTWRRSELPPTSRVAQIGFRCAYDVAIP